MTSLFTPPYPKPHRSKSSLVKRFFRGWTSWIHVLFEKSYRMKMGEVHTPGLTFYIANELSLVQRILVEEADRFPKHRMLKELLDPLIGNSVFSANGADWAAQREMVNPAFSHTALARVFPLMKAAVDALIARTEGRDLAGAVAIDPLMTHVAADVIYRTLFSRALTEAEAATIHEAFHAYQRHAQWASILRIYGLPTVGLRKLVARDARRIHAVFAPIVRARHEAGPEADARAAPDILGALIAARHPNTGERFSYDQIMEQVSTIFLAGHETAASAMTWALYLLAACPDVQRAVRAEALAAAPDGAIRFEALKGMVATRNVFSETLRLYPPVSFYLREVTCPTRMRDKDLSPGAMLAVSPWLVQRNDDNWQEPHGFDPGRFADAAQAQACRHAFLPFGRGPRICVGAGFAQAEAMLVLASFVTAFELETVPGDVPEPVSRLTLRPRKGLRLKLRRTSSLSS